MFFRRPSPETPSPAPASGPERPGSGEPSFEAQRQSELQRLLEKYNGQEIFKLPPGEGEDTRKSWTSLWGMRDAYRAKIQASEAEAKAPNADAATRAQAQKDQDDYAMRASLCLDLLLRGETNWQKRYTDEWTGKYKVPPTRVGAAIEAVHNLIPPSGTETSISPMTPEEHYLRVLRETVPSRLTRPEGSPRNHRTVFADIDDYRAQADRERHLPAHRENADSCRVRADLLEEWMSRGEIIIDNDLFKRYPDVPPRIVCAAIQAAATDIQDYLEIDEIPQK